MGSIQHLDDLVSPDSLTESADLKPWPLLSLPPELVLQTLRHLSCTELLRCKATCKVLRDTIASSYELQYIIELAAAGMVEGPHMMRRLPPFEQYTQLLDSRRRWRTLDWTRRTSVHISGSSEAYDLVGGVFAKASAIGGAGGLVRRFIATPLPPVRPPRRVTVHEDVGFAIRDFAMDPNQDLVVFVDATENPTGGITIHLRTLSHNEPHPRATMMELHAPLPPVAHISFTEIAEDVVGMLYWTSDGPGIFIWHWPSGTLLVRDSALDFPRSMRDFMFLSPRAIMTTDVDGNGRIRVYTFGSTPTAQRSLHLIVTLGLPPLRDEHWLRRCTVHVGPLLAHAQPFVGMQEPRVHVLSLTYERNQPPTIMFVMNKFLLSSIPTGGVDGLVSPQQEVHWNDWGPKNTRIIQPDWRFRWLRYAHGARVVFPLTPALVADGQRTSRLRVLDFNVHPTRMDDPLDHEPVRKHAELDGKYELVAEPSSVPAGELFTEDVVSGLPYAMSTRVLPSLYDGLMIDEGRVIGVTGTALAMNDLDVYTF